MFGDAQLEPGERLVMVFKRGGKDAGAGCLGIFVGFVVLQVIGTFGVAMFSGHEGAGVAAGRYAVWGVLGVVGIAVLGLWFAHKRRPAVLVTDKRIIGTRFLFAPFVFSPREVGSGQRVVVQYRRYGAVVREGITNRVAVRLRNGNLMKVGPVAEADDFIAFLNTVSDGSVDPALLGGANGEPARAEQRDDVFFASTASAAGRICGPVFVGPTAIVAWANQFDVASTFRILSLVGQERAADELERVMVNLSKSAATSFGSAVVMHRAGADLRVDGASLVLSSQAGSVAFELAPKDAERAKRFTRGGGAAYRS